MNIYCNEDSYASIYLAKINLNGWKNIYSCKYHLYHSCVRIWPDGHIPIRNPPNFGRECINIENIDSYIHNRTNKDNWDNLSLFTEMHGKIMPIPGPNGEKIRRNLDITADFIIFGNLLAKPPK